jgi:hypothetical protein
VERLEKLESADEAARLFLGATIRGIFDEIARRHEGAGVG